MYETTGVLKNKDTLPLMEILKNKRNLMIISAVILLISAMTAYAASFTNFQDQNNPHAGMKLNTVAHTFEIHNPSGVISTGHYEEHSTFYVIMFDGGLAQNVMKTDKGVMGPNGEQWVRK